MTRSSLRGVGSDDKLSVTKIRNNYFIAHLTNADLSIMNDFDTLKEELNIVNKSFVTLGKPIVIAGSKRNKSEVKEVSKDKDSKEVKEIKGSETTAKDKDKGEAKSKVVVGSSNVIIRDTMLLAPQGCRSLEKIGSLYGEDFKKVDIAKDLKEEQKDKFTKDLTKEQ